jgi:hypothetical protein
VGQIFRLFAVFARALLNGLGGSAPDLHPEDEAVLQELRAHGP